MQDKTLSKTASRIFLFLICFQKYRKDYIEVEKNKKNPHYKTKISSISSPDYLCCTQPPTFQQYKQIGVENLPKVESMINSKPEKSAWSRISIVVLLENLYHLYALSWSYWKWFSFAWSFLPFFFFWKKIFTVCKCCKCLALYSPWG